MVIVALGENFVVGLYTIDATGSTITSAHAVRSIAVRCTDNITLQLRQASTDTTGWPILPGEVFTANITRAKRESGGGASVTWNVCHLQASTGSSSNVYVMFTW